MRLLDRLLGQFDGDRGIPSDKFHCVKAILQARHHLHHRLTNKLSNTDDI